MKRYSLIIGVVAGLWVGPWDCKGAGPSVSDRGGSEYWLNRAYAEIENIPDDKNRLALIERIINPLSSPMNIPVAGKIIAKYSKTYGDKLAGRLPMYQIIQGDLEGALLTANSLSDKNRRSAISLIAMSIYNKTKDAPRALKLAEELDGFPRLFVYSRIFQDLALSGQIEEAKKLAPKIVEEAEKFAPNGGGERAKKKNDNYIRLGELFRKHDDFRPVAKEIIEVLEEMGETPVTMAEDVGEIGNNTALAVKILEFVGKPTKNYYATSQAYYRIAFKCSMYGRKEECRPLLSKSLADAKMINNPSEQAFKMKDIAGLQARLGYFKEALQTADLATAAAIKIEGFDKAKILCHITGVQIAAKDLLAAEKTLQLAIDANEKDKTKTNKLQKYMSAGLIHNLLALGKEEEAHKIAAKAPEKDRDMIINRFATHYSSHGKEKALEQYLDSLSSPEERVVAYVAIASALARQQKEK